METIQQDLFYIGKIVGAKFSDSAANPSSGGNTSNLTMEYFSQLGRETVRQLYNLYRLDFELFGYSPNTYINLAL